MKKYILPLFILSLLSFVNIAQTKLTEDNIKTTLTKIFDLSKNQNYSAVSSLLMNIQANDLRSYNYSDKIEAKAVKRNAKKINAYLDLSDSYEYQSLSFGNFRNNPSAELKVNFTSGDQKLTISFLFVEFSGKIFLYDFK